jgi:small redox-active disulfide protein 2
MSSPVSVIEILGPICARCKETYRVVQHVVDQAQLDCRVEKNTSLDRMVELGVLSSPAVVIDGKVVLSGWIPGAAEVRRLLGLG